MTRYDAIADRAFFVCVGIGIGIGRWVFVCSALALLGLSIAVKRRAAWR